MARVRLAPILSTASGKFGSAVFSKGKRQESVMRELVIPDNPRSVKQVNVRAKFSTSGKTFQSMPKVSADAWNEYAAGRKDRNGKPLTGIAAYNGLATKYRLINNNGTPPLNPPTTVYAGDNVTFTATAGTGSIVVTPSKANANGTTTEILIQRLAGPNRKPQMGAYKTALYQVMTGPTGTVTIPVTPGYYSLATRFCSITTGEQTDLQPLSVYGVTLSVMDGGAADAPAASPKRKAA